MATTADPLPRLLADPLARLRKRLEERFGERLLQLRLFGSYARSEAHEDSDVDVLVVVAGADHEVRRWVLDAAADVGVEAGLLLSPTVLDDETFERHRRQQRPLVTRALREGRVL